MNTQALPVSAPEQGCDHYTEVLLRRVLLALIVLLTCMALSAVYILLVAEKNAYLGFKIGYFSLIEQLYLAVFAILPVLYLPLRLQKPSELVVWMLFVFVYIPGVTISGHSGFSAWIALLLFLSLTSFFLFTRVRLSLISLPALKFGQFVWVLGVMISVAALLLFYLCLPHFGFSWSEQYERRLMARDSMQSGHLFSYFISIARSALVPFAVVVAIYCRQWLLLAVTATFLLVDWGSTGVKATFVVWFVAAFIALKGSKFIGFATMWLASALFVLILSPLVEYLVTGNDYIADYLIRRIFIVPGVIIGNFWDYLALNYPTYYADTGLSRLLGLPIAESPTYAVGRLYIGNVNTNANTNFWVMEGARLGLIGPIFVSCIGGLICSYLDQLDRQKAFPVGWCIAFIIGVHWSEQAFATSLLTSGIAFLMILFALIPSATLPAVNYEEG